MRPLRQLTESGGSQRPAAPARPRRAARIPSEATDRGDDGNAALWRICPYSRLGSALDFAMYHSWSTTDAHGPGHLGPVHSRCLAAGCPCGIGPGRWDCRMVSVRTCIMPAQYGHRPCALVQTCIPFDATEGRRRIGCLCLPSNAGLLACPVPGRRLCRTGTGVPNPRCRSSEERRHTASPRLLPPDWELSVWGIGHVFHWPAKWSRISPRGGSRFGSNCRPAGR